MLSNTSSILFDRAPFLGALLYADPPGKVPSARLDRAPRRYYTGGVNDERPSRTASGWPAYALGLAAFAACAWWLLSLGAGSRAPAAAAAEAFAPPPPGVPGLLLLQALVVLAACRVCAAAARRLGQPEVIGEIAGGLLLGPSLLGALWPAGAAALFPPGGLGGLRALSEIGILLFLFTVGLEMDLDALRGRARAAVLVSHASIAAPFLLGLAAALWIYPRHGSAAVPFHAFALFIGVSLSVTAFPVLARILHEQGLERTPLGAAALTCAAVDDATAWCALAAVAGIVEGGGAARSLRVILSLAAYGAFMATAVRALVRRWYDWRIARGASAKELAAAALCVLLASAFATETIGVHALFGAFLAGIVMPERRELRVALTRRFEELSSVALLPLFFALTGLRTRLGLLDGASAWLSLGLLLAAASAGKLGGTALAARASGLDWRESLSLGALMNARGLVELVVLNVGYDLGVLTPAVFSMLVLMALVTTAAAGPLLSVFLPERLRARRASLALVE